MWDLWLPAFLQVCTFQAMTTFKRTKILPYSKVQGKLTADDIYWKRLEPSSIIHGQGFVSSINFNPSDPACFAACRSAKVEVYNSVSHEMVSTFTKFKSAAYGAVFREDGNLLACGTQDGRLKIFHVKSGKHSTLRNYTASKLPVHGCQFTNDGRKVVSFSDDGAVKLWDIGSTASDPVTSFSGHTDHVRCGTTGWLSENILVSGSYDHTAKLWDVRSKECTGEISHGSPIEALLIFPNDGILATAGGTVVKLWSLGSTRRRLARLSRHHKTVTAIAQTRDRLISAGLDKQVKIFEKKNCKLVYTMRYAAPILCLGISRDEDGVAVGMAAKGGLLSIQRRRPERLQKDDKGTEKFHNLQRFNTHGNDVVLKEDESGTYSRYDQYLRTFQHSRALTYVCTSKYFSERRPEVVVSLIRELSRRGALRKALVGRQEADLVPLLRFLARHINTQRFLSAMLATASLILEIYDGEWEMLGKKTRNLLAKLEEAVRVEVEQQTEMFPLIGSIELIITSSRRNTQKSSPASIFGQPIYEKILQ